MSPTDLGDLFARYPDKAIKLTLTSGDSVVLPSPGNVMIDGLTLSVYNVTDPARRMGKGWRVISIPNIALAEPHDGAPPVPRRRR
jgi:hypothetical protein